MRRYLLMGACMGFLLGCAGQLEQQRPPRPMAYLKHYETVFNAVVRTAQELSWEVVESDPTEGIITVYAPLKSEPGQKYNLKITVEKRRDGMTEVKIASEKAGEFDELSQLQRLFALKLKELMPKRSKEFRTL